MNVLGMDGRGIEVLGIPPSADISGQKKSDGNAEFEPVLDQLMQEDQNDLLGETGEANLVSQKAQRAQLFSQFMDSLEGELGISRSEFAMAMKNLNPNEQKKTPLETIGDVVNQLQIPKEDRLKVANMYLAFLFSLEKKETAQIKMKDQTDQLIPQQVIADVKLLGKNNLEQNDAMMNKFSTLQDLQAKTEQNQILPQKIEPTMQQSSQQTFQQVTAQADNQTSEEEEVAIVPLQAASESEFKTIGKQPKAVAAYPQAQAVKEKDKMESALDTDAESNLNQSGFLDNMNFTAAPKISTAIAGKIAEVPNQSSAAAKANENQFLIGQRSQAEIVGVETAGQDSSSQTDKKNEFNQNGKGLQTFALPKNQEPFTDFKAAAPHIDANVQNILDRAQVLAKQGGGEMRVQLSPEGLGEIRLRVSMVAGKIEVQMTADNPEARKLIETHWGDLRHRLDAQSMSIDKLQIDSPVSASSSGQRGQDLASNHNSQRDNTRQFWNQFQDNFGNRSQREGFAELPNIKSYGREIKPLEPIATQARVSSNRLDVVA